MKKINIKDVFLDIDMLQIFDIKDVNSIFFIDIDGNIYVDEKDIKDKAIIFISDNLEEVLNIKDIKLFATAIFEKYKPEMIGTTCRIKPLNNWQNIIDLNKNHMLYFDHQSDGVEIFEDSILEDYGWHATALEIKYRQISDFIEENCEGTLLFYDNEIQFSGFAVINNIEEVRKQVRKFIIEQTLKNKENNLFELDDDDVIEALEFFELEV